MFESFTDSRLVVPLCSSLVPRRHSTPPVAVASSAPRSDSRPPHPRHGRGESSQLRGSDRAIEGLPIRLVIALVVGVASLSVMMQMISGLEALGVSELDVRPQPEVTTPGAQELTLTVVDSDGDPVADATVVVRGGSADIDGVATARTGPDGRATVEVAPTLRANQEDGELLVDVKPPAGTQFADRRGNTRVLVVAE